MLTHDESGLPFIFELHYTARIRDLVIRMIRH